MSDAGEPEGPGPETAALDAHVDSADGGPAAHRWTPHPVHTRAGPSPVAEVTAHRMTDPDHWHLVTYGLSWPGWPGDDPEGWGFELTFRLGGTEEDPEWAVELLTNLAAYVRSSGHPFAPGHHLDLRGPIRLDADTVLTAAAVVEDPALAALEGPAGTVEFLQLVGLAADELELCRSWSTAAVLDMLGRDNPLLVTRLERASLLDDPGAAGEIAARSGADGSELTELRVATLSWRRGRLGRGVILELGSGTAAALGPALRRELVGPGARFSVVGDDQGVTFVAGETPSWRTEGADMTVEVPAGEVEGLAALFDGRTGWGRRPGLRGLRVHVVR